MKVIDTWCGREVKVTASKRKSMCSICTSSGISEGRGGSLGSFAAPCGFFASASFNTKSSFNIEFPFEADSRLPV